MPSVSINPLTGDQKVAFNQQIHHIAHAHRQALKLMFEGQRPYPLTVRGCMWYYNLAKAKLTEFEFERLAELIGSSSTPGFDIVTTLVQICDLLQHHPDLIQGFGMFLPPDINLQMQSWDFFTVDNEEIETSEADDIELIDLEGELEVIDLEPPTEMEASDAEAENQQYFFEIKYPPPKLDKNYAAAFLNKVKERFLTDKHVFERFLELLQSVKENSSAAQRSDPQILETEVFYEVCELFCGHNDLIDEFKVFVPDAAFGPPTEEYPTDMSYEEEKNDNESSENAAEENVEENTSSSPGTSGVSKSSFVTDPSMATVYKYGTYEEHQFFDEVRIAVEHKEVYDNFLRCLMMYNEDIIIRSELVQLAKSFLGKFPDLLQKFKKMLGYDDKGDDIEKIPMKIIRLEREKQSADIGVDIDFSTGGRNGANYRALPKTFEQPKCSGRTPMCKEVLNDTWVSFPSWSEDSTFVTSCKTQYEEIIYRCEDERFELDMAITANASTMNVLTEIQKRMNKMPFEERTMLHLDDSLNTGGSTVIHQRALHRLYGDKTSELVEGLKRNPWVAVPIILKRLKAKDDEWKEKQKKYNDTWRTQIDQYYLKSLDHQGINFTKNDGKSFRPKNLLNEMEMVYAEKKENQGFNSSHFILEFKEMEVFQDAIDLMLQYLKKIPGVYRDDRRRIELVIRSLIPDIFASPRCTLNDGDLDLLEEESRDSEGVPMEGMETRSSIKQELEEERSGQTTPTESTREEGSSDMDESNSNETDESEDSDKSFVEEIDVFDRLEPLPETDLPYTMFFVNKIWYVFFRQFHILCERLARLLLESAKQSEAIKRESYMDETQEIRNRPTYKQLIDKLRLLLSGSIDNVQFEEDSRSLFGIHAFVSYTMDKLVLSIVRQLQQVVTDDTCKHCTALFIQSLNVVASAGINSPMEAAQLECNYLKKAEKVLGDERCFKVVFHKKQDTLTIELLDKETDNVLNPVETEKWSDYLDEFVNGSGDEEDNMHFILYPPHEHLPVILPRNLRKMKAYWEKKVAEVESSWQLRQSAKFLKKNIMTNKKRKALALISHSLAKMARRSSNQESSVHSSNSRAPSVEIIMVEDPTLESTEEPTLDSVEEPTLKSVEEPAMESVEEQTLKSTEKQALESVEERALEDQASESVEEQALGTLEDATDMDVDNAEEQVIVTTEEDSEKSELVLLEITGGEMGVQEESVQDTTLELEIKLSDLNPELLAEGQEIELQFSLPEPGADGVVELEPDNEVEESEEEYVLEPDNNDLDESENDEPLESSLEDEPEKEESETIVVEDSECAEDPSQGEDAESEDLNKSIEIVFEGKSEEAPNVVEKAPDVVEKAVEDKGDKPDPSSKTEPESEIMVDVVTESPAESVPSSPEAIEEDKTEEEEEPPKRRLLKRRTVNKPYDYSIRTRKNRTNQTYVKRRLKRGLVRIPQSPKSSKRRRTLKKKTLDILDDPTFDYNYFSELSQDDKIHYLVFKYFAVQDDIEVSFNPGSYKINFVQNCNLYLYRAKSMIKAKEAHQSISEIKTSNFEAWHRVWQDRYVTSSMLKFCNDWLLKSEAEIYKVVRINVGDCKKPPYIPYYKYKIRYYKTDIE